MPRGGRRWLDHGSSGPTADEDGLRVGRPWPVGAGSGGEHQGVLTHLWWGVARPEASQGGQAMCARGAQRNCSDGSRLHAAVLLGRQCEMLVEDWHTEWLEGAFVEEE